MKPSYFLIPLFLFLFIVPGVSALITDPIVYTSFSQTWSSGLPIVEPVVATVMVLGFFMVILTVVKVWT